MFLQLFTVFLIGLSLSFAAELPKVKVDQGEILGTTGISRNGKPYYQFLGIPYGKVPQRFGLSEPADAWEGTRDATKLGPWCLQNNILLGGVKGQEDCLVLNVYTPSIKSQLNSTNSSYPVMVYIHGGGFVQGSANEFGGKYLMNENVVLVAMNYRLGALGFLNANVEGAAGNQALKDIILALKWVQTNIEEFSGDKTKVTIFGESAGAGAVSLLTISPLLQGLALGAISQSGAALCPFVHREEPPEKEAKKLANLLDCPASDPSYMVQCLQKIKAENILDATKSKYHNHLYFDVYDVPQFGPSIETYKPLENSTVFMPEHPLKMLTEGNFNRIPWINGVNAEEGIVVQAAAVLTSDVLLDRINEEWGRVAPSTFLYHVKAKDPCALSSKIHKFYFGDEKISMKNGQSLIDLYSDRMFIQCSKQTSQLYAKYAPVYNYFFTHENNKSVATLIGWPDNGGLKKPGHADDLLYLFDFPIISYGDVPKGSEHEQFSDNFIKLWVSFANEGKPTALWGNQTVWPKLEADEKTFMYMNIDNELKMESGYKNISGIELWDELLRPIQEQILKS